MSKGGKISKQEARELAALYALDALLPEEKAAFEQHLQDAALQEDVRQFDEVAGELGFHADPVSPPQSLRDRLLSKMKGALATAEGRGEEKADSSSPGILFHERGLLISRAPDMKWKSAPLPGISTKLLFDDPARRYTTQLVRMAPRTTYPSHHHADVEELYLLEGDLLVEGQRMKPGDYCRAEPDSVHGEVSTESGALFLALSSQRDEPLTGFDAR